MPHKPRSRGSLANQSAKRSGHYPKVYRREIVAFLDTLHKPVLEATSQDLIEFRRGLRSGLKPATVSRKLSTLRSFFRFLAEGGYRETNPAQVLKLPKIANTSPYRVLTAEELRALVATADLHTPVGVRDYAILMLLSVNALRESELVGLDQEDLNIAESYSVAVIRGKGSKVRVCKIAGTVAEALAAWQALRKATTGPIFVAVDGKRITNRRLGTRSIRYRVKHYALAAGITRKVSPHALRHAAIRDHIARAGIPPEIDGAVANFHCLRTTFCTLIVESTENIKEAMILTRHKTAQVLLDLYAKVRKHRLSHVAEKVGEGIIPIKLSEYRTERVLAVGGSIEAVAAYEVPAAGFEPATNGL